MFIGLNSMIKSSAW